MVHFDTGFPAPLFKPEVRSADVERFTKSLLPSRLTMGRWTRVEFSSLLAKDVRIGLMTSVQADGAEFMCENFVARTCTTIDVARHDFELARQLLADRRSGLRAGDALHLAVASNNAASGVYSLDRIMIAAGRSLGLPMNVGFPATT